MKPINWIIYIFIFIIFISQAHSLAVTGKKLRHHIQFEPGYTQEDTYQITNNEGYTSDYLIHTFYRTGADLSPYITITPERIQNVANQKSASFTVKLELPDKIDHPGRSLTWVKVDIDNTQGGGIRAVPSVAVSYYVYVLYPTKYITWSFNAPNMNVNEKKNFSVQVENLGEPTINTIYADISVVNLESNQTIQNIKTNTATNFESWDKITLLAEFDSTNLDPGNYKAIATLNYDGDTDIKESNFRIGSKNVEILNFTKKFELDAINKFDIIIESAWNTQISNIYADIIIYDLETNKELKKFKSLNTDLKPWEKKTLEAFFDTSGLEKKEYKAVINLNYEGASTRSEGIIKVDENINAETVEEIPGKFKLNLRAIITPMNILILLLIIFIIINIILAVGYFKRQPPKPPAEPIDPAVIDHINELRKKYNDNYIKEMMLKKGWSKEKVDRALKQASKKR